MPILSVSTKDSTDWWEDLIKESAAKKQQPVEFKDDPVAMACAVHRSWKADGTGQSLDLGSIPVEPDDRARAKAIRCYYGAKFVEMALRGHQVSEFRLKMAEVLDGRRQLAESEIGLLYRLPYFYEEDTETDWIYENTASDQTLDYYRNLDALVQPLSLTPLRKIFRARKNGNSIVRYWFLTQHRYPAVVPVAGSNPLNSLMNSLFQMPVLQVDAGIKLSGRIGQPSGDRYHLELFNLVLVT